MKTVTAVVGAATIAAGAITPAFGQVQPRESGPAQQNIGFDTSTPLSPSSATSTVSPSSVPQAMERMADSDTVADISLGTIYAEGKFGTNSRTTIWSSALGARLRVGEWKLSASLPWMRVNSRSTIITGIDSTPVLVATSTSLTRITTNGFGNLTLGAGYTIAPTSSPIELELSGRAKINTATRASRLSSGKNDYALGIDVSVPLARVAPFASFTYRVLGDSSAYHLRDGPAASIGFSSSLSSESFVLASYHYAHAATRLISDAHELFAGASARGGGNSPAANGIYDRWFVSRRC